MKYRLFVLSVLALINQGFTFYKTTQGRPVRWYQAEIPIELDASGTEDIEGDAEFEVLVHSMQTWNNVTLCKHPEFVNKGKVSGLKPSPNSPHNLIIFESQDQWVENGHNTMDRVIAWTTLYFDDDADEGNGPNGKVHKFDLELADFAYHFTITDYPGPLDTDLQNTVTHELGHALGLDHSKDPEATMYWTAAAGEVSKRDLADDDIEGLCTLYKTLSPTEDVEIAPDVCCPWHIPETEESGDGCKMGPVGIFPLSLLFLAFLCTGRCRR